MNYLIDIPCVRKLDHRLREDATLNNQMGFEFLILLKYPTYIPFYGIKNMMYENVW